MFYRIGALKTFAKFTGKLLRWSNFNVNKLIGWDPATSVVETLENSVKYVPVETLEKGVRYVQSSDVFIIDFEHISDLFLVFLLITLNRTSFLCKYHYPKSTDEPMLYLNHSK